MKKIFLLLAPVLFLTVSCDDFMKTFGLQGTLQLRFAEGTVPSTKAAAFPDTNDFILSVTDEKGNEVYSGNYGGIKERLPLDEGVYTVSAKSCEFSAPLFDTPQYGDTQVATIKAGRNTVVTLTCIQMNSGIRLKVAPEFQAAYPTSNLYLKSSAGRLMYGYNETRIAYFQPGTVNLEISDGGETKTLFTKRLEAQQILTLTVNAGSKSSKNGVDIQVDTTRTWLTDDYTMGNGGSTGGDDMDKAYDVTSARTRAGEQDVWVYGYIVGGDQSSSNCSFKGPFSSRTNIAIATKSSCKDKSICLSVQLAKGDIRDALNLVDHPENLGKQVFLKGDLVGSYYGIPGIQNLSKYQFK
jgi:hypothetical protein